MSEMMLALLGFATIIMIIVLLLRNVTVPAIAFIGVSTVTALILILTGTFSIEEMGDFISAGVKGVHSTAALFIFSVLFFGIMSDVGMFDRIINALMKKVGNNVAGVAFMTCIIAMIGHLDGGGASTFLITIPAMLPVYKRLKMRPTTLLLICVTAMGVMNLMPWGGPTMRAASVLEIEANTLWMKLLPMQLVGIGIALFTAFFWGTVEKKRGAGENSALVLDESEEPEDTKETTSSEDLTRPKLFGFNVVWTLLIIAALVFLDVPSYYTFMVGCVVALLVNYPGAKLQGRIIKSHAGPALTMASTILAAGVFRGTGRQRDYESDGSSIGFLYSSVYGPFPAADYWCIICTAYFIVLYRFLFLWFASGAYQCGESVWRGSGSYGYYNGCLPELCYLYQSGGSGYFPGSWLGRRGD